MHPDLQRALDQFNEVEKGYEQLITSNMSKINEKPSYGGWSIAECVDHVNSIARQIAVPMKAAIDNAKASGKLATNAPLKSGFLGKYMTRTMEPPVKKKMGTPKIYTPSPSNFDANVLLEQYKDVHNKLRGLLAEADAVNITKVRMASPAIKLVKMNLGDWFFFTAAHERRHLSQGEKIAKNLQ